MGAKDSHGVVVVWVGSGVIHRPETGYNHGETIMKSATWELFPNRHMAEEAGYTLCGMCFWQETHP